MDNELSRKERTAQRRQAYVDDFYHTYIHEYEMSRAWGLYPHRAAERSWKEFNNKINALIKGKPQETSFILSCKGDAEELIKTRVNELEQKK